MADTTAPAGARRNYWAIASLLCGVLGLAFALTAPIPFVPVISIFNWPLGLAAILAGWAGRRQADAAGDSAAAKWVGWGIRLGCAGWIVQFLTSVFKVLVLASLLAYFAGTALNGWPAASTPAP